MTLLLFAILWAHIALALTRSYQTGPLESATRGFVAMLSIGPAVILYRAVLFFTVYLALRY